MKKNKDILIELIIKSKEDVANGRGNAISIGGDCYLARI